MDVGPVAGERQDQQEDSNQEQSGGFGGVSVMTVLMLTVTAGHGFGGRSHHGDIVSPEGAILTSVECPEADPPLPV